MRLNNEPDQADGLLAQLFKLQTEFSARLTEETVKYLRRLQGMAAPASPETVLLPTDGNVVAVAAAPSGEAVIELEVENRQRVHTVVSASLTAMVASSGVTWFPQGETNPAMLIVAPGETRPLSISVSIPAEVPPDTYRGAVLMPGFTDGGVPVEIAVTAPKPKRTTKKATAKKATTTAKSATSTAKKGTTKPKSASAASRKAGATGSAAAKKPSATKKTAATKKTTATKRSRS